MDDLSAIYEVGDAVHVADDGLHALGLGGGYKVVVFEELAHLGKEGGILTHLGVMQALDKCVRFLLCKGVDEFLWEFDSCQVICLLPLEMYFPLYFPTVDFVVSQVIVQF